MVAAQRREELLSCAHRLQFINLFMHYMFNYMKTSFFRYSSASCITLQKIKFLCLFWKSRDPVNQDGHKKQIKKPKILFNNIKALQTNRYTEINMDYEA